LFENIISDSLFENDAYLIGSLQSNFILTR
jgi:hypothetical protein